MAAASLDSQLGFTWESPSPAQVAAFSDCFIAQAGWPRGKHRWGLASACTTPETPELAYPVDRSRPCQSVATLSLHSDPPQRVEVGGQWSQPVLAADCPG